VPHTQEFLEGLANLFFPVVMCAHEGFSRCSFAHRTPVMEISMMKEEKRELITHMHILISPSLFKPPPNNVKVKPVASLASCKKELMTEPIMSMHLSVD
jgi:hypothetical protein